MDEFIETTETIRELSRTAYIPIRKEADHLGLGIGDKIGAILFRPKNLEHVKGCLYGSNPYLFFVVAGTDGNGIFYDIRKSVSERILAQSLDYEPITIPGPFETLSECRRFRNLLDERQEADPSALKEQGLWEYKPAKEDLGSAISSTRVSRGSSWSPTIPTANRNPAAIS